MGEGVVREEEVAALGDFEQVGMIFVLLSNVSSHCCVGGRVGG